MLQKEIVFKEIKKANNIAICFNSDINSLNTALLLENFIKNLNKTVSLFSPENININKLKHYSYPIQYNTKLKSIYKNKIRINLEDNNIKSLKYQLVKDENDNSALELFIDTKNLHLRTRDINIEDKTFNYDLLITINLQSLKFLGSIYSENIKLFKNTVLINIDNDPANELYGTINLVDIHKEITSLIIFEFYKSYLEQYLNKTLAEILLTDLLIYNRYNDIKIKYSSLIKECINLGADYHKIKETLFANKDKNYLTILASVLRNIEIHNNIVLSIIPRNISENNIEIEDIIDDLMNDILKYINDANYVILSIENIDKWQHIVYILNKVEKIRKIQEKFQVLQAKQNKILIETELRDINNIHKELIEKLKD